MGKDFAQVFAVVAKVESAVRNQGGDNHVASFSCREQRAGFGIDDLNVTTIRKNMMPAMRGTFHRRKPFRIPQTFKDVAHAQLLLELHPRSRRHGSAYY